MSGARLLTPEELADIRAIFDEHPEIERTATPFWLPVEQLIVTAEHALRAATPDPAPPLPLNDSNGPWCGCGQRLGHAVPNVDCTPDPAEHGHTRKVCEQCWKAGYDAAATHDPAADER
jgi:hypothetical protein